MTEGDQPEHPQGASCAGHSAPGSPLLVCQGVGGLINVPLPALALGPNELNRGEGLNVACRPAVLMRTI